DLLKLVAVDGLDGSGRLDGRLPIALRDGALRMGEGRLAATGPGVLHYKSSHLPPELTGAGPEVGLALQALEDFHYEELSVELSQKDTGEGTMRLKISGNNPAVLDGQVFNLNINLESNFDRLARLALEAMQSAQTMLRQAERSLKR